MSYNISSDKFTHPLLKPILLELTEYFKDSGISFFVIGATARDIIMELNNEKSGRLTYDLDIAITVNNWKQWRKVENEIVNLENFTKDPIEQQRFLYKNEFELDIVPFGEIMNHESKIIWPPNENIVMSVLGFNAAENASIKILIDEEIEIKIASLCGIFLLKLIAWKDRNNRTNKDAEDIGFILENYLSINEQRAGENYYDEIYDKEDFKTLHGGATLLGKDIFEILIGHPNDLEIIKEILNETIEKQDQSRLINQILETHKTLYFEDVLKCIQNIHAQLGN
jgi:predicted nucleotidyltransferase